MSLFLALIMCLSLAACGGPDKQPAIDAFNDCSDTFNEFAEIVNANLDAYTEDEIESIARISPDSLPSGDVSPFRPTPTPSVKKKPLKSKNIRISAGTIWTTLRSALLTAYSRTASTVSDVWRRLREKLQTLPFWTRIFSRR